MAACETVLTYDVGAVLLGIGFSLIGAVPALHILGGWEQRRRSLVFGAYLAFGGLGGAIWPSVVVAVIGAMGDWHALGVTGDWHAFGVTGDWRGYWWFMVGLMALAGAICLSVVREKPNLDSHQTIQDEKSAWTLLEALRTPQFYIIGCGIAATYLVASTVNAFTVSHLTMIGVATTIAVIIFSIQSACHAAFPLLMGGIVGRVGVKTLLVFGLTIQAIGMLALAEGSSVPALIVFAIGVGGGYGTIFLATTLSLQDYFGRKNYAQIFGTNQLFTTISVIGPAVAGWVADLTGRFDISFLGCVVLLSAAAAAAATLRPPEKRTALLVGANASA